MFVVHAVDASPSCSSRQDVMKVRSWRERIIVSLPEGMRCRRRDWARSMFEKESTCYSRLHAWHWYSSSSCCLSCCCCRGRDSASVTLLRILVGINEEKDYRTKSQARRRQVKSCFWFEVFIQKHCVSIKRKEEEAKGNRIRHSVKTEKMSGWGHIRRRRREGPKRVHLRQENRTHIKQVITLERHTKQSSSKEEICVSGSDFLSLADQDFLLLCLSFSILIISSQPFPVTAIPFFFEKKNRAPSNS